MPAADHLTRSDIDPTARPRPHLQDHDQQLMVRPAGALIGDLTADIIAVGRLLDRLNPRMSGPVSCE
ncbi:hypothetical protein [Actinomadura geliboluensis]|uniref:hypothetical protein n=1 Tax=Actinomadura geliboluensis TaxID=882440 RepID=UPI0036C8F721